MPFFHRKTLISRELRKIAPSGFHHCELATQCFHLKLWATPRTPSPRAGAREVKSRDFQKCRPGKTCFRPLLKVSPILLEFGMIALKTLIHKTVDQILHFFTLRRDIGFQTWSNPQMKIKCRPAKTCSPPLAQNLPDFLQIWHDCSHDLYT